MKHVLKIAFLGLLSFSIYAADVRIVETEFEDSQPMILIEGEITKGDAEKIRKLSKHLLEIEPNFGLNILINSIGGDVLEAIEIGRFLRSMLADVTTKGRWIYDSTSKEGIRQLKPSAFNSKDGPNIYRYHTIFKVKNEPLADREVTKCYSACVLILVAGVNRHYQDTVDMRFVVDPNGSNPWKRYLTIGLHRPYYSKEIFAKMNATEAEKYYKMLETLTRQYLEEMGASTLLIEKMLRTKSTAMEQVDDYKFRKYLPFIAPFFEEWKIAKCGEYTPNNGLTSNDKIELKKLEDEFNRVTPRPDINNYDLMGTYFKKLINFEINFKIGNGKTIEYYENKSRSFNRPIGDCVVRLIREHQIKTLKDLKI